MTQFDYNSALNYAQKSVRSIYASRKQSYDEYDIQEAVSDTLEKVCRYADTFDPERGSLGGWVYRIARNCSTDYGRKKVAEQQRLKPLIDKDSASEDDEFTLSREDLEIVRNSWTPEREMASAEEVRKIESCLDILNERDRNIAESLIYGLSYEQIAVNLGMTVGHVRNRVCHLRKRIHTRLENAE